MKQWFLILLYFCWTGPLAAQPEAPNSRAILKTSLGNITIKLLRSQAPKSVENFVGLATGSKMYKEADSGKTLKERPFYNGLIFHRVHPELGIFTGCPWGTGRGWPGFVIDDETQDTMKFDRPYLVAMAKIPNQKQSVGSQFFITTKPMPSLDGEYPIFGEVIAGFEVVKAISERRRDAMMKPIKQITLNEVIIE